jgi:small nuclear ribonucleoprotein (snRNP)-like protein
LELLKKKIGEQIYVRLRNQTGVEGQLVAYDEHLNMMIQNSKISKGTDIQ